MQVVAALSTMRLPVPTSRPVAAAVDGDVLLAGGLTPNGTSSSAVELIDPAQHVVRTDGRLIRAVHDAAGIVVGGRFYVAGGGATVAADWVQRIAPGSTGVMAAHLPTARADVAGLSTSDAAYLIGGYDGTHGLTQVLRTRNGTSYRVVASLPLAVRYPAVAQLGSTIWVFGGEHDGRLTDVIQKIDLSTSRATVAGHLPEPLGHAAAMVLDGHVIIAGGKTRLAPADTETADVLEFDPTTRTARRVTRLPAPVSDAGVAVVHGVGHLLGGEHGRPVNTVTNIQIVRSPS